MGTEQARLYETRQRRLLQILQTKFDGKRTLLAEAIERGNAYVSFLLSDKDLPHHKNLGEELSRHIEVKLGLPKGWLDGDDSDNPVGTESPLPVTSVALPGFTLVRRKILTLTPGDPTEVSYPEEQGPALAFRTEWLKREGLDPNSLALFYMEGDNMEDRIHDGDTLLIDTRKSSFKEGHIYAIRCADSICIKRARLKTFSIVLQSDNPTHPEEEFSLDSARKIQILGRVAWVSGAV